MKIFKNIAKLLKAQRDGEFAQQESTENVPFVVDHRKPFNETDIREMERVIKVVFEKKKEQLVSTGKMDQSTYILCRREGDTTDGDYAVMESVVVRPEIELAFVRASKIMMTDNSLTPLMVVKTLDTMSRKIDIREYPECKDMTPKEIHEYIEVHDIGKSTSLMILVEYADNRIRMLKYDYIEFEGIEGVVMEEEPDIDNTVTREEATNNGDSQGMTNFFPALDSTSLD